MDSRQIQSFLVEFFRRHAELVEQFKLGDYSAKDSLIDKVLEESKGSADPQEVVLSMNMELLKRL